MSRWVGVAALVLAGGVLVGAGFRYLNALPTDAPSPIEASTIAALAVLGVGIVLLVELQRSRARLESIDGWAIVAVAALVGVLAGLISGPLPNNARAFRGTVHLELTSPIKAKFDAAATTVHCETVTGTDRIAWLSATSLEPVQTPAPTPAPKASGLETPVPEPSDLETPEPERPALALYLTIRGRPPPGIAISASPTDEPMTGLGSSLEIVAGDRSGRATFSGLHTEETWIGYVGGGDLAGSVRWACTGDRLPDG